jgi:hypothetical protein
MKPLGETLLGRSLGLLSDVIIRFRWVFLFPQILLFGLCVQYTWFHLQIDPSRDDLVGADKPYHRDYMQFKREFPSQDDLVVAVESEDAEKNRQFVERLGARLDAETNIFTNIFYRNDFKMLGRKALLFVPEDDLKDLRGKLRDYLPFIGRFTQTTNLLSLFSLVNSQFLHASREANADNDALIQTIPILQRILDQADESLLRPGIAPSPGITAFFGAGDEDIYIVFTNKVNDGRLYLVTAQARTEELNDLAVDQLRRLVDRTRDEVPGVNAGVTGGPVLDKDEMEQSQRDATRASIVSLVLCALIFIYGYQETGRPLKATFCLIIGLGYTLAFTTFTVGHLNLLTITFLPILIGLAIDFGVHLITRYEEELRKGRSEAEAMRVAMQYTGQGIFTGALTSAFAFLAMSFTNFKGIQEMGIICGGGMLICFVPMMTLLPVLLYRGRQNALDAQASPPAPLRSQIENLWLRRPVTVCLLTAGLGLLAATGLHKVYFDYDLLNMQSPSLPSVVFEKKLINSGSKYVLSASVVANTAEEAVALEARIRQLPSVLDVESMAPRLVGDQTEKLRLISQLKNDLAAVHFAPADFEPVDLPDLSRTLLSTAGYLGNAVEETETNEPALAKQLSALRDSCYALRRQMLSGDASGQETSARKLAQFQQALFTDVRSTFAALRDQDDSSPLQIRDLPPGLRNRFIGVAGKFLLQVFPKKNIWQRDNQKEFVEELRTVAPGVTDTPVQLLEYTELLRQSYIHAAYYALIAIALMVFVHFRTLTSVVLALLPVAVGSLWMFGLMGYLGIPLNPANIMTLPLVIGIGVTNGIHILNRFAEEPSPSFLSKSTGKAVFVSGLTAIAGFASLILGQHHGIRSLGEVMSLGLATCMLAALTFLPAVLTLWLRFRRDTKQPSGDNARSTLGREEPR